MYFINHKTKNGISQPRRLQSMLSPKQPTPVMMMPGYHLDERISKFKDLRNLFLERMKEKKYVKKNIENNAPDKNTWEIVLEKLMVQIRHMMKELLSLRILHLRRIRECFLSEIDGKFYPRNPEQREYVKIQLYPYLAEWGQKKNPFRKNQGNKLFVFARNTSKNGMLYSLEGEYFVLDPDYNRIFYVKNSSHLKRSERRGKRRHIPDLVCHVKYNEDLAKMIKMTGKLVLDNKFIKLRRQQMKHRNCGYE